MQESVTQVSPNSLGNPDVLAAVLLWAGLMALLATLLVLRAADPARRRGALVGLALAFLLSPFIQAGLANLFATLRAGRAFSQGFLWGPVWYPPLAGLAAAAAALLWVWVRGRMAGGDEEARGPMA